MNPKTKAHLEDLLSWIITIAVCICAPLAALYSAMNHQLLKEIHKEIIEEKR